jgi:hypothetical protein
VPHGQHDLASSFELAPQASDDLLAIRRRSSHRPILAPVSALTGPGRGGTSAGGARLIAEAGDGGAWAHVSRGDLDVAFLGEAYPMAATAPLLPGRPWAGRAGREYASDR